MKDKRLYELFEQYQKGSATDRETDELMVLLKGLSDEELSFMLEKSWEGYDKSHTFFGPGFRGKVFDKIHSQEESGPIIHRVEGKDKKWLFRMAAAAVLLLAISITVFVVGGKNRLQVAEGTHKQSVEHDILPGGDKAVLTLADGRQIILDTASNGDLVEQGGIKVIKIGGQLSYDAVNNSTEVLYNTISTPKGGQYQLELADGSKVWLNSASSLRFPTAFSGKERLVELTGEGYFEITHDPAKPFQVKVGEMNVEVLGTHFNINSYSDEPAVKTTLLEGRVSVKTGNDHVFLNPGQQAVLSPEADDLKVNYEVDVEEVVAWKNGKFLFNNADIGTITRQLARWYDVDVVFEKTTNETYSGGLPRSQNVSQLLKMLEATGSVNFAISGKKIVVKSK